MCNNIHIIYWFWFTMHIEGTDLNELLELLRDIKSQLTKLASFTISDRVSDYINASTLRLDVFDLCDGHHTVGEISQETGIKQPNVSAVISELLSKGLIREGKKDGRSTYYMKAS